MATGILENEKHGVDALLAGSVRTEPFPLPDTNTLIELNYSNKIAKEDVLVDCTHDYLKVAEKVEAISDVPANSFLLADNYYGLQKLLSTHKGKVQLIYLDPPYGTGMEFHSRDLEHAYKDIYGTAAWVEMMRRRLFIMRELMSNTGVIYLHIGHQMLFHLKVIMDEVFGSECFRNLITRRKCSSKNSTTKQFPNIHDYILFYSKSKKWYFDRPGEPAPSEWIEKEYTKSDQKGRYKLVPVHAPGTRNGETGKEWRGKLPPEGKHWQLTPTKLDELDSKGEIHWSGNGNPRRKVYLTEGKKLPITDHWHQFRDAHHQSKMITGYPTEKNLDMLKMIVESSTKKGDLVLDPFCGSGTTLQAARDLGRSWIGIDQSFTAAKATLTRMNHGLTKMGDYVKRPEKPKQLNFETCGKAEKINFVVDEVVYLKHKSEINFLGEI